MGNYDPLYVKYIYYFNVKRDYYECHEVLEALWVKTGRALFYQGMLQAAVALYHFRNGNVSGAIKLFRGALEKLAPYDPIEHGIDLTKFRADCEHYKARLEAFAERPFSFIPIKIHVVDLKLEQLVYSI